MKPQKVGVLSRAFRTQQDAWAFICLARGLCFGGRAAVAAIKEKGVLSGKRIERSKVRLPGEFDSFTDEELKRAIMERLRALGLSAGLALSRPHRGAWSMVRTPVGWS